MNVILSILSLNNLNAMMDIVFLAIGFAFLVALAMDRLAREFSFGIMLNALIAGTGVVLAMVLSPIAPGPGLNELMRIATLAASISIGLLLALSSLRRYLANA